jgi:hypothetical protein
VATKTKLIVNPASGQCLCVSEVADHPLVRMRGLIGRRALSAGEGMLLSPAPAIHTAFMRFSIDAVFLDRDMQVVGIVEQLGPWRLASKHGARSVLELAAGECARRNVQVGDTLELRDRRPQGDDAAEPRGSSRDTAGAGAPQAADGTQIQPRRVLVISPDHHFRSVMSLLLGRHNCSVTTTANAGRATDVILRQRPDVAVIDASESADLATIATVATVQALAPLGVVLVGDPGGEGERGLPVIAKWGPFDDLLAAIVAVDLRRPRGQGTDVRP